jgi:hypothetical protein
MTPSIDVRRASAADRAVVARLLSDMQAHYRSPDAPGGASAMALLLTRGLGIGRALLVAMARIYDRLRVPRHDKVFYRLSGDDLRKLAAG